MTREEVWKRVAEGLREPFGRLLDVRDVRRVRRVAGDAWMVTVVLAAPSGDLHVADVTVDATGAMSPVLGPDHVIEAVRSAKRVSLAPPADDFGGFGDEDEDDGLGMLAEIEEPIESRVAQALARGDPASLREARELLPRLLTDHDRRGATLLTMADVETKLGEPTLARGYLEAAAREFADRFDLDALEKAAALALELLGRDAFAGSPVHMLLEQSRARLKPLDESSTRGASPGLPDELRAKLASAHRAPHARARRDARQRGRALAHVFVVKSGLVGVWLEKPSGGSWLVRCCFPGWLLGESSVLAAKARAARRRSAPSA